MSELTKQELHNLAMNIVGEELEKSGYEFLGVNSEPEKDPQFVALKDKKLHFIIVRAVSFPNDPFNARPDSLEKIKAHAKKFKAKLFFAGVGLANPENYEVPVERDSDFVVNYNGMKEI